jgi:hypothetical protein
LNSSIQRSTNSISSITSDASTAFHASAVLIWWWKIIIGSCNQCQISEYSISNVVTWLVQTGGYQLPACHRQEPVRNNSKVYFQHMKTLFIKVGRIEILTKVN